MNYSITASHGSCAHYNYWLSQSLEEPNRMGANCNLANLEFLALYKEKARSKKGTWSWRGGMDREQCKYRLGPESERECRAKQRSDFGERKSAMNFKIRSERMAARPARIRIPRRRGGLRTAGGTNCFMIITRRGESSTPECFRAVTTNYRAIRLVCRKVLKMM